MRGLTSIPADRTGCVRGLADDRRHPRDPVRGYLQHLIDRGALDSDGMRHSAKLAWRALALLQTELERGA